MTVKKFLEMLVIYRKISWYKCLPQTYGSVSFYIWVSGSATRVPPSSVPVCPWCVFNIIYIFAVFNIKALVYALAKQFHFSPLFAKCMFNIRTTCIKPIYQSFFLQLHFSPSFCAEGKNNNGNYAKKLANWLGRCVLYILANGVIYVRHCWPITYVWRGIFRKNWRIGWVLFKTLANLVIYYRKWWPFGWIMLEKAGQLGEFKLEKAGQLGELC